MNVKQAMWSSFYDDIDKITATADLVRVSELLASAMGFQSLVWA